THCPHCLQYSSSISRILLRPGRGPCAECGCSSTHFFRAFRVESSTDFSSMRGRSDRQAASLRIQNGPVCLFIWSVVRVGGRPVSSTKTDASRSTKYVLSFF